MIIVSRIIHVKVDRRLNVTNKFKYQRRVSNRFPIVMFRGTPCKYIHMYVCCVATRIRKSNSRQLNLTISLHYTANTLCRICVFRHGTSKLVFKIWFGLKVKDGG